MSGGLRSGIELILLAGYAGDFFWFRLQTGVFSRVGGGFGSERGDRSQAQDLLRSKADADLCCASDDLEEMNGVGTEIKQAVVHADTFEVQNFRADRGEFCFRGIARSDEQVLLRKA